MIFTKQQEAEWTKVPGSSDYISTNGRYVAVYKCTHSSGYPVFWVFFASSQPRERVRTRALALGGLPMLSRLP